MKISDRPIGPDHPPFIIAEMSGNHNGDINRAYLLLEAAKASGADAVKLQTYTADTITIKHDGPEFTIKGGLWDGRTLYDLYNEAHTPWNWHEQLFAKARELDLIIFSSPFDHTAVDFLEDLGAPAYKIASFELIDLPLIRKAASTGKPLIMSTGLADLTEINEAIAAAREGGAEDIVLLHCVSGYPTPASDIHLRTIPAMQERFGTMIGLSDHTMGIGVPAASVALGAVVIEKHFTLRRADGGPDSTFSLEPDELRNMVAGCYDAWAALGRANFDRVESEKGNVQFRRSLYIVEDVQQGETFTERNVRSIRPGHGLPPKLLDKVLGKTAKRALPRGTPLSLEVFE